MTVFYLIPISLAVSFVGLWGGLATSVTSVFTYLLSDRLVGVSYAHAAIPYWNSGLRLAFFVAVTYVLHQRKRSGELLARSEERFRLLVEGIHDYAIFALDARGSVMSWNEGAARALGHETREVLGRHFSCFFPSEDGPLSSAMRDLKTAADGGKSSRERLCVRKDGSRFWAEVVITRLVAATRRSPGYSVLIRDITERKRGEEAVRAYARLHEIDKAILEGGSSDGLAGEALRRMKILVPYDRAVVILLDLEADQALVLASEGVENPSAISGSRHSADWSAFDGATLLERNEIYVAEVPAGDTVVTQVLALTGFDGARSYACVPLVSQSELIGLVGISKIEAGGFVQSELALAREVANQLAVAIHNVQLFEQVRDAHRRMTALSRRLLEIQESERRHLARELHDEMGQMLTAVKIQLQEIESLCELDPGRPRVRECIGIVEKTLQRVRDLSLDLRPHILDDLGLVAALRWYLSKVASAAGLVTHFSARPAEMTVPAALQTSCFRIAQEALTNTIRHADATRVSIELRQENTHVHLTVKDDGVGFDLSTALERTSRGECLGLLGMRERAHLLGGQLEVESALSFGTEVRVRIPVEPGDGGRA